FYFNQHKMKALKILYYNYLSFYKKVDDEPHAMTVFVLGFTQSLPIVFIIQIVSSYFFCYLIPTWIMMIVGLAFIGFNYLFFSRTGISKQIVRSPPPIIINKTFTK